MLCPYSSSGTTSAARPWIAMSTICVFGVGSRLTSATRAPASLASEAKDAAGYTIPDVPMMSSTSHERTAARLRSRSAGSNDSPNQTMCGRSSPLHVGQRGGMGPVHVLRDQPEALDPALQVNQRIVGGVRALGGDELAPPVVPFPDQPGVAREGLRGCQVFGSVGPPEPVGSTKCRYPAVCRDPRARQDGHRAGPRQSGFEVLDGRWMAHVMVARPEGVEPPTLRSVV